MLQSIKLDDHFYLLAIVLPCLPLIRVALYCNQCFSTDNVKVETSHPPKP